MPSHRDHFRVGVVASVCGCLVAVSVKTAVAQQPTWPPRTMAEWLRTGTIFPESLAAQIPGFVDIAWNMPGSCSYTVYLTDPDAQASTAERVLKPLVDQRCPSDPHVYPARSDFTRQEGARIRAALVELLREAGEPMRDIGFARGRWFVQAINPAHRDRVAALLKAHEDSLPLSHIDLRLREPPYELDPPVRPRPAVYLAIADSLPRETVVDTSGLSTDVVEALRSRFRLTAGECGTPSIRFGEPTGYEDNRFVIATWQLPSKAGILNIFGQKFYVVTCREYACRVTSVYWFGDAAVGCRGTGK